MIDHIGFPVSDYARAKAFYLDQCGFDLIVDHIDGDFRVVQLNPHGSSCSIAMMPTTDMVPGSIQGLHLVVTDIAAARAELAAKGVDISEPYVFGPEGRTPGIHPTHESYATFADFRDPDGNTWLIQEVGYEAAQA